MNNNNEIDLDQLKDLDQFKEIFDMNSILNNIFKKGNYNKKRNKNEIDNNNINNIVENNNNNEENIKENDEIMENNFDFQDYNDNNNYNNKEEEDFDMGYVDSNINNNNKLARGKKRENNNNNNFEEKNKKENNNKNNNENKQKTENKKEIKVIEKEEENNNKNKDLMKIEEETSNKNEEEEEEENSISIENENEEISNEKNIIENSLPTPINENKKNIKSDYLINTSSNKIPEKIFDEQSLQNFYSKFLTSNTLNNNSYSILSTFYNNLYQISLPQISKLSHILKQILSPNVQSKLIGNYKTGKRLNMKRIINFIASNYRQDKIWLRRTLPFNRNYFITISIDNSLSMKYNNIGYYALQSMLILIKSLQKVGIENFNINCIEENTFNLYDYNKEKIFINNDKFIEILNHFNFNFQSKNSFDNSIRNFLIENIKYIENNNLINNNNNKNYNINFIISDGRFNKNNVKGYCALAKEKGIIYVFIIIDKYGFENKESIINMKSVDYNEKGEIVIKNYLEDFPFQYYTVVQDIEDLPEIIKNILIKWLETFN